MAIDQKLINRINELAKKKKTTGLSDAEIQEQKELREIYLKEFRQGFKNKVEAVDFLKQFTIAKNAIDNNKLKELNELEEIKEITELTNMYLITYFCNKITEEKIKKIIKNKA